MSDERVQYDGEELDEIVAENVTVHIEQMDTHHWMIRIYRPEMIVDFLRRDAVDVHLTGSDLFEVEDPTGLPVINRPPIPWCHQWEDRRGRKHACFDRHPNRNRHRCDCGSTTPATNPPMGGSDDV